MNEPTTNMTPNTKRRVLTLVVKVNDKEQASGIWESLKGGADFHGLNVVAMAEGDRMDADSNDPDRI